VIDRASSSGIILFLMSRCFSTIRYSRIRYSRI